MIKCPSCGEMLEDHAKFCINCGAQIKSAPAQKPQQEPEDEGGVFGRKPYHNSRADFVPESQKEKKPFFDYNERRMAYEKQEEEIVRANPKYTPTAAMRTLSSKLRSAGIVLVVSGILQIIYGFAALFGTIALAIILRSGSFPDALIPMIAIAVGMAVFGAFAMMAAITNLTSAGRYFRCAKKAMINPKGLSESFSINRITAMFVLNILSAGIIGIIGTVMAKSARNYASANMREIEKIEAKYQ